MSLSAAHWLGSNLYLRIRKVSSKVIVMAKKPKRPATVSDQLKDAILNCGQTRYRIAQETGITEATLSKFIHGHHGLSLETVDTLGKYLGLKLVVSKPTHNATKGK
jgi:predicted transcriptional regulator